MDLNFKLKKYKTIKFLQKNRKKKSHWHLGLCKEFLDLTSKAQCIKEKLINWT